MHESHVRPQLASYFVSVRNAPNPPKGSAWLASSRSTFTSAHNIDASLHRGKIKQKTTPVPTADGAWRSSTDNLEELLLLSAHKDLGPVKRTK